MDFLSRVKKRIVLFDGAMGTMLLEAGLSGGDCPEQWNKTHPEVVSKIHEHYFQAGCDVVATNSFGGCSLKLASYGLAESAWELNKLSAELAKMVAPEHGLIAGSIGPCGLFLKPLGDLDEQTLYDAFKEQALALAAGGADLLCIETMMDLNEAIIAVHAAKENTPLPVVATMTFNDTPNGFFTMMGITPEQGAEGLVKEGADVVGANCGNGPQEMKKLVTLFAAAVDTPLIFQSNAGLPKLENGVTVYDMGPEEYSDYIPFLVDSGAGIIGGCCGTTPLHMAKIKDKLDAQ